MQIQWRLYEPRDKEAVELLHAGMEAKVGRKLPLPDLLQEPIIAALVGETNGVITHGFFLEAQAEVCSIGVNPLPPSQMGSALAYCDSLLNRFNIQLTRAFIPNEMAGENNTSKPGALERILKRCGFSREREFVTFFRWTPRADVIPASSDHTAADAAIEISQDGQNG